MPRAKYTPEQKQAALDVFVQHGPAEAARQTGIPQGTIASWATRAGVQSIATENATARVEAAKVKWAERRQTIADEFGTAAMEFVQHARDAARKGDGRVVQALMTSAAIGVDKAQLLSGGATGRVEHEVSDPNGRSAAVHDLRDRIRERRERAEEAV